MADAAALASAIEEHRGEDSTSYARLADVTRIAELEDEVRHLKAELAARSLNPDADARRDIIHDAVVEARKAQQASRDAILRKINRGG